MTACGETNIVNLKISRKGFKSEDDAREDAYRRIQRAVDRKANQEGWCDGAECGEDEECTPTYPIAQRNEAVEPFTYKKRGEQLYGYDVAYPLDVTCRCV